MKRLLAVLSLALLLSVVAAAGVASAAPTSSDNLPRDFAIGSGHVPALSATAALSATSGPSGENAQGHYRIELSFGLIRTEGPVTCLATQGNIAVAGGPNSIVPDAGAFIMVEDNGTPSEGVPDRVIFAFGAPATQEMCQRVMTELIITATPTAPIDPGNFTVHDAPAAVVTP